MTPLALILRYWQIGALAAALAAGAGWFHEHDRRVAEKAIAAVELRRADSLLAVAQRQSARIDTVYRLDTLRLTELRTKYDTLRQTIVANIHDTTEVVRFIVQADSTIKACVDALHTCEAKQASLAQERDAWKAKALAIPGTVDRSHLTRNILFGVVGVAAGYLVHRH